jgi:forkhead transcription factor HCM1
MLIGMAILRAPHRRLTLAQIYKSISDTYSYYNAADAGWQNSIRHNLSLNKAFVKQERPKDDPGKGNYWAIEPGKEMLFTKDKLARKGTALNKNSSMLLMTVTPAGSHHPTDKNMAHKSVATAGAEISSDATIPLSDASIEEESEEEEEVSLSFQPPTYSLSIAPDKTLQWDPPADSEELAIALSYHFPRPQTLEAKMQAATKNGSVIGLQKQLPGSIHLNQQRPQI